jgi:hypothetical protein
MKKYLATLATVLTLGAVFASVQIQPAAAPTKTLTELAQSVGLKPSDYSQLVVVLGEGAAIGVIRLQAEFNLDKATFRKEFRDIGEALIDLVKVGIAAETAMYVLRAAVAVDPSLSEVTTITYRVIDLKEKGVPVSDALARAKAEVAKDRSDDDYDDDDDQDDDDDDDEDDDKDDDDDDDDDDDEDDD